MEIDRNNKIKKKIKINIFLFLTVVMFEDSVTIGIGNSDMDEFTSTPTCPEKIFFPYFHLERTVCVHIFLDKVYTLGKWDPA